MFKSIIRGILVAVMIIAATLYCGFNVVNGNAASRLKELDETLRVYEMELRRIDFINSYFARFS